MRFVFGLACLLAACSVSSANDTAAHISPRHDKLMAFAYLLAVTADCKDLGRSAGKKLENLTKGNLGVLDEQNNLWLPKVEPVVRDRIPSHGPCLS